MVMLTAEMEAMKPTALLTLADQTTSDVVMATVSMEADNVMGSETVLMALMSLTAGMFQIVQAPPISSATVENALT